MSRNVNDSRYAREITQSNSRRKFNSKRAALAGVRMVSFRCQQTRVNFPNSERWAKKFTIAAECSEVSKLKNKRNHRCFLSNRFHRILWNYVAAAWHPYWSTKGRTSGGRKQNTWSPIDGRVATCVPRNNRINQVQEEGTNDPKQPGRSRELFQQRGKNNSKRKNVRSFIGTSCSHNLNFETTLKQITFSTSNYSQSRTNTFQHGQEQEGRNRIQA